MPTPGPRTRRSRASRTTPAAAACPPPDERAQVRAQCARWAAQLHTDPNAVILDTETTSKEARGRVVEVAALDITGRELVRTRVNPGVPIAPEAAAVHGITPAMLADAPPFAEIADALTLAIAGRRIVAWNAPFDRRILAGEYARLLGSDEAGQAWADRASWECAMRQHAAWTGQWCPERRAWKWHKLAAAGGGDHTAAGDCRAVARVLAQMAATAPQNPDEPVPVPSPRGRRPARGARARLEGTRADVEALAQALREGRAQVEHLDEPAEGRRGGYLAYGRLTAPEGAPRV